MRVRMPVRYYGLLAVVLNQTTIDNETINAINFASFTELRTLLLTVAVKHMTTPDKKVSKTIPDSYGLLFFASFNGIPMMGFENVVIKELCKQVERQLYYTGKYKFVKP